MEGVNLSVNLLHCGFQFNCQYGIGKVVNMNCW